jgi:hypothetical protein
MAEFVEMHTNQKLVSHRCVKRKTEYWERSNNICKTKTMQTFIKLLIVAERSVRLEVDARCKQSGIG